jgi:hypothetical protein
MSRQRLPESELINSVPVILGRDVAARAGCVNLNVEAAHHECPWTRARLIVQLRSVTATSFHAVGATMAALCALVSTRLPTVVVGVRHYQLGDHHA